MKTRSIACLLIVAFALIMVLSGAVMAADQPATQPTDVKALQERVRALEKENLVLREDLGKARLDARADLDAAAKRQAEMIAKTNQALADTQAQIAAEKKAQAKRNRNLWLGLAVVAIGAIAAK